MNNATTEYPYNDDDDNKSIDIQEEEEVKEKSVDIAKNYKLISNNNYYDIILFIYIAQK